MTELGMKPLLIIYATREGQSRRIAEHLAAATRTRGFAADVINAAEIPPKLSVAGYAAILLVASVHIDQHQREKPVLEVASASKRADREPAPQSSAQITDQSPLGNGSTFLPHPRTRIPTPSKGSAVT